MKPAKKTERFYFVTPAIPTDDDIFLHCDLIIHTGAENPCGLWWKWLSATDLYQEHARSANSLPWSHSEAQPQCMSS